MQCSKAISQDLSKVAPQVRVEEGCPPQREPRGNGWAMQVPSWAGAGICPVPSGKQLPSLLVSVFNCQLGRLRSIVRPLWVSVSPPRKQRDWTRWASQVTSKFDI